MKLNPEERATLVRIYNAGNLGLSAFPVSETVTVIRLVQQGFAVMKPNGEGPPLTFITEAGREALS